MLGKDSQGCWCPLERPEKKLYKVSQETFQTFQFLGIWKVAYSIKLLGFFSSICGPQSIQWQHTSWFIHHCVKQPGTAFANFSPNGPLLVSGKAGRKGAPNETSTDTRYFKHCDQVHSECI